MLRHTIDALEASLPPPSPRPASAVSRFGGGETDAVLTTNLRLVWNDVAHLFPPQRDVERILDYFLREMVYIMIPVQEKQFWRAWTILTSPSHQPSPSGDGATPESAADTDSGVGISRSMVGSLLLCLASTSYLIPERREEQLGLTRPMAEQREAWITAALALVRTGTTLSPSREGKWLHYAEALTDSSLDRLGFETLAVRIFALLGMSELSYHLNGESLRRAIRINLYDDTSAKAAELLTVDERWELTEAEAMEMRRRLGAQMVVTERWTCLYTGRPPMLDDEAEGFILPRERGGMIGWAESEEVTWGFSRFVSKLRVLPAQLGSLTTRKAGDWATQRARDQEAVTRVLELDRGLCKLYDPALPRASLGGRSHSQILAELDILNSSTPVGEHGGLSDAELNQRHREFAEALVLTSSWLSLRCLVTSNLMFLPWVQDARERYYALNLARRLIELLPGIWMMASSPYVPFSSSWISRHLFLACTVLSVPILGQEPSPPPHSPPAHPAAAGSGGSGGESDFAPSNMQRQHVFSKLSSSASRVLSVHSKLPASSSVDLDWFSGKLVEIASLFSKLASRGDQTAGVNTKLIHALLNSRAELRDRVLDKLGQKQGGLRGVAGGEGEEREVGRIESQRDLTSFVMATSVGKSGSPSSSSHSAASPAAAGAGSPGVGGYKPRMRMGRVLEERVERVSSPSLHDLANAVDTYTSHNASQQPQSQSYVQHTAYPPQLPHPQSQSQGPGAMGAGAGAGGWEWALPPIVQNASTGAAGTGAAEGKGGAAPDALASVPLLLDPQDWLAILDGVDIPL